MSNVSSNNILTKMLLNKSFKDTYIGGSCSYCFCKLTRRNISKDHVIPRCSRYRSNSFFNLVPTCQTCNNNKGDTSLLEFLGLIPGDNVKIGRTDITNLENLSGLNVRMKVENSIKCYSFYDSIKTYGEYYTYPKAVAFAKGISLGRLLALKENCE